MIPKNLEMNKLTWMFLKIVPRNWLSRTIGRLVNTPLPAPFRLWSLRWFSQRYKINEDEAEKALTEYQSIGAFFVRRLKPGLRPIQGPWAHPCDAQLTEFGTIENGQIIQAKGIGYSVFELIGDARLAETFEGGHYLTYYLCPTDYHRVHAPTDIKVDQVIHLPGDLWPVNADSVKKIPKLFTINERLVVMDSEKSLAMVFVGATNVGEISLSFDQDLRTNIGFGKILKKIYPNPIDLKCGEEVGTFHMGSTIVLLLGKQHQLNLKPPLVVKMGSVLPV